MTFTEQYDDIIKLAVKVYLPKLDWLYWKAQLAAESSLDPNAVSSVGAQGIAQFMPSTWDQIAKELGFSSYASPTTAWYGIVAGAYYMATLRNKWWTKGRTKEDHHFLAVASYNAGIGNMYVAQKVMQDAKDLSTILQGLRLVTGEFSQETMTYVMRVKDYYAALKLEL